MKKFIFTIASIFVLTSAVSAVAKEHDMPQKTQINSGKSACDTPVGKTRKECNK